MIRRRARAAWAALLGREQLLATAQRFDSGDVLGLDQQMRAIRRGDGHTVVRWTIRKAWGEILSCDVRAEHAVAMARQWEDAAELVHDADPDQDWDRDPIRDSWSGGPVDPHWWDEVSEVTPGD